MHEAILYVTLFHSLAALELFALAAVQACRAPRRAPRMVRVAVPMPSAVLPDNANSDFAESFDEAA